MLSSKLWGRLEAERTWSRVVSREYQGVTGRDAFEKRLSQMSWPAGRCAMSSVTH